MIDEANHLCDRIERLVADAKSVANDRSAVEKRRQVKEIGHVITKLERAQISVPDDLCRLQQTLSEDLGLHEAATNTLSAVRGRLLSIAESIAPLEPALRSPGVKARKARRTAGSRTTRRVLEQRIVEVLHEMGGRGRTRDVLDRMYEKMQDQLLPGDLDYIESAREDRWRNTARWACVSLRNTGVLKKGSQSGIWELA